MMKFIKQINYYIEYGIWKKDEEDISIYKKAIKAVFRYLYVTVYYFKRDNCIIRASALTFFSLLSIVPLLALFFAIAKGFGLEQTLTKALNRNFEGQEEVVNYLIDFSQSLLNSAKGGIIAGVGIFVLLWSVLKLLNHIESAFNAMWNIKKSRPFLRKFTDYLTLMFVTPILLFVSSSITIFLVTVIKQIGQELEVLDYVAPIIIFLIKLTPYILIWIMFTLLYIIMPNTKVKTKNALIAGIIAGTLYQLVQLGYVNFQVEIGKLSTIYGSFAALPLFLGWLQISWIIILLGAELSFSIQKNNKNKPSLVEVLSISTIKKISLSILHYIVKKFSQSEDTQSSYEEIKNSFQLSEDKTNEILNLLQASNLIVKIKNSDKSDKYIPGMDTNLITLKTAINKIESAYEKEEHHKAFNKVNSAIHQLHKESIENTNDVLLKSL